MYDFISIDFETANRNLNSACSVGITAINNHSIVDEYYSLICPPDNNFDEENVNIHHICYDDVKNSPTFKQVYDEYLKNYIEQSHFVIAHNAQFDMSVLRQCMNTYKIQQDDFLYIDNMLISSFFSHGELEKYSLENSAAFYNVPIHNHHNALDDARTVSKIILQILEKEDYKNFIWAVSRNDLKVKKFSDIHSHKTFFKKKKKKVLDDESRHCKPKDIVASVAEFDETHPFYKKTFVLTGELQDFSRKEAMQIIVDFGGVVRNSVSKKTNYLLQGPQNIDLVNPTGISSKERKAYQLIDDGVDITIISEDDFKKMI